MESKTKQRRTKEIREQVGEQRRTNETKERNKKKRSKEIYPLINYNIINGGSYKRM